MVTLEWTRKNKRWKMTKGFYLKTRLAETSFMKDSFGGLFHGNLIYFENLKNSSRLTFRYLICYRLLMSSGLPSCGNLLASSLLKSSSV